MRHGELIDDSISAFRFVDGFEPCGCGHQQNEHDEDACCYLCDCEHFTYDWPSDEEGNL